MTEAMSDLRPSEDYIEPELTRTKTGRARWKYDFQDLEVGDQMRCVLMKNESDERARVRVASAAICWKKKNRAAERAHIRFSTQSRNGYVLLQRMS